MATHLGPDRGPDFMVYVFVLGIIGLGLVGGSIIYYELSSEPLGERGICTDKYVENGTYFMKIGNKTFEVDGFYYDALIIGEGYSVRGYKNKIDRVQLYREED